MRGGQTVERRLEKYCSLRIVRLVVRSSRPLIPRDRRLRRLVAPQAMKCAASSTVRPNDTSVATRLTPGFFAAQVDSCDQTRRPYPVIDPPAPPSRCEILTIALATTGEMRAARAPSPRIAVPVTPMVGVTIAPPPYVRPTDDDAPPRSETAEARLGQPAPTSAVERSPPRSGVAAAEASRGAELLASPPSQEEMSSRRPMVCSPVSLQPPPSSSGSLAAAAPPRAAPPTSVAAMGNAHCAKSESPEC